MNSRVMQVFYGQDLLPYKDRERKVHYPITGNSFAGSNKTTNIHFYVDEIGGTSSVTWVIMSKLPNGKIGYEILSDIDYDDENIPYLNFEMSAYYTSVKGDLYLALRGYQGEVTFTETQEGIYEINGDPIIQVTGTIKFAINYAPMINTGTQVLPTDVDKLILALNGYIKNADGIVVLSTLSDDISKYASGQLFFVKSTRNFYRLSGGTLNIYRINAVVKTGTSGVLSEEEYQTLHNDQGSVFVNEVVSSYYIYRKARDYGNYMIYKTDVFFSSNSLKFGAVTIYGDKTFVVSEETLFTVSTSVANNNSPVSGGAVIDYVKNKAVRKFTYAEYGLDTDTTILELYNAIGWVEPALIEVGSVWYFGRLSGGGITFYFEFETVGNSNRFVGSTTNNTLTLGQLFNTSGSYYKPYSTVSYVDEEIQAVLDSMVRVFYYRGSKTVAQINATSSEVLAIGDVYNVEDSGTLTAGNIQVIAGDNVVWDGTKWDKLAGTIDLSGYVQKTQTIAGITLSGNISASDLANAINDDLNLTNTTTDVTYILGD